MKFQVKHTENGMRKWIDSCTLKCRTCKHPTKRGTACKRKVCIGLPYCNYHRDYRVGPSSIKKGGIGMGVFATTAIQEGTHLFNYEGESVREHLMDSDGANIAYAVCLSGGRRGERHCIDASCERGIASMINSFQGTRRKQNVKLVEIGKKKLGRTVAIVATRHIRKGSEILLDYGPHYFSTAKPEHRTTKS
jgi:hypothetical protein